MSVVTSIILTCDLGEEQGDDVFPPIDEINAWLMAKDYGKLEHLNGHAQQVKERGVWVNEVNDRKKANLSR